MSGFFVVDTSEDLEFYESIGIKIAPTTRVYKRDELKHTVEGMVFEKQFKELKEYI